MSVVRPRKFERLSLYASKGSHTASVTTSELNFVGRSTENIQQSKIKAPLNDFGTFESILKDPLVPCFGYICLVLMMCNDFKKFKETDEIFSDHCVMSTSSNLRSKASYSFPETHSGKVSSKMVQFIIVNDNHKSPRNSQRKFAFLRSN